MATSAETIIRDAQISLQDHKKGIRWPASELARYLNDGQLELITFRPDQNAVTKDVVPAAGARQTLPPEAVALVVINRNTNGRFIRNVEKKLMDAVSPGWTVAAPDATAVNYMYDLKDPRTYWLCPPAKANAGSIEMVYGAYPAEVSASGALSDTATGVLSVPDTWAPALLNYVLGRAYDKDAEYGGNAAMSAQYMASFNAQIGKQIQSASAISPKS